MMPRADRRETPALETKVALLKEPGTYPDKPRQVSAIETHMSWVFLTDAYAYKLKKPVRYDYLDFSTLAAREWNCREELRLNQRLAPGVYLAVVPLQIGPSGEARFEGEGAVVEWLVKMRRLPAERMLDHLIRTRALQEADVKRLAQVLVTFYRENPPVAMGAATYRAQYAEAIAANRRVLSSPRYGLPAALVTTVHEILSKTLGCMPEIFDRRTNEGRIVEAHGDLRPEHVCLEARPVVFDRLEFNRQFRILDAVEELSFFAMECEHLGAPFVESVLFDAYTQATGDDPPRPLRDFYMAHRACVRARLSVLHTIELDRPAWAKWLSAASAYLRLAESYCCRL